MTVIDWCSGARCVVDTVAVVVVVVAAVAVVVTVAVASALAPNCTLGYDREL